MISSGEVALQLLNGQIPYELKVANAKHGGLFELLPDWSNADRNALKFLLSQPHALIFDKWNQYIETRQRVRAVSLQALAKAVKA